MPPELTRAGRLVCLLATLTAGLVLAPRAMAETRIAGSATVMPFVRAIAERAGDKMSGVTFTANGTGDGIALFCRGGPVNVALASRPMTKEEKEICSANGVAVGETLVGYDGLVLASAKSGRRLQLADLSLLALYRSVSQNQSTAGCGTVQNPHDVWQEIDSGLPRRPIVVLGPNAGSGTLDSFVDLALMPGALADPCLAGMREDDPERFRQEVNRFRLDGRWIDGGSNDSVILGGIRGIPASIGILNYAIYEAHADGLHAISIEGIAPTRETIAGGSYPLSRALFIYADENRMADAPEAQILLAAFSSPEAVGPGGYLTAAGLLRRSGSARAPSALRRDEGGDIESP